MAVTHTPVNLPNDVSAASMGANNIVIDGRTNSTTAETTLYACWDPSTEATSHGYSNHNLTITASSSGADSVFGNFYIDATDSDGYYWRCKLIGGVSNGYPFFGIHSSAPKNANWWNSDDNWSIGLGPGSNNGKKTHDQTQTALDPALSFSNGDYCDICLKNGKLYFGKNGTWSGDPDAESGEAFSSLTGMMTIFFAGYQSTSSLILDTVGGTAPSGAKRLTQTVTGFGNYCVANVIGARLHSSMAQDNSSWTWTNGNLTGSHTASGGDSAQPFTQLLYPGNKYHFEYTLDTAEGIYAAIVTVLCPLSHWEATAANPSTQTGSFFASIANGSSVSNSAKFSNSTITAPTNKQSAGDRATFEVDMSTIGSTDIELFYNGATDTTWSSMAFSDEPYVLAWSCGTETARDGTCTWIFGQLGFDDTPSAGFKAMSTATMSAPSYTPSDYFNTVLYNGNGSDGNAITGVGFAADFIWIKDRENGMSHRLYDSIRGVNAALRSDTADPQDQLAGYGQLETTGGAFSGADGFTVGVGTNSDGTQGDGTNKSGEKHVAWCWKAGGAPTATNSGGINPTSGSRMKGGSAITTAYASANIYPVKMTTAAHGGFSIFTYTGTGTAGHTVPHGLDAAPSFVIIKDVTDSNQDAWQVGHVGMTSYDYTFAFNSTDDEDNSANWWNDTAPSSTLITLGDVARSNDSGETHVCYAFSNIEGLQKFGSYAGNGSNDGNFIYLGFKPSYVLIKRINADKNWMIIDAVRDDYNIVNLALLANSAAAESSNDLSLDFTSNGFKLRLGGSSYGATNQSGGTYVYAAFAETPFALNNRAR